MFGAIGAPVARLVRVRIGTVRLGDLRSGEVRPLAPDEVRRLASGAVRR
jgi:16S rRNA U516 pseudouridylate synthase RsuA-like enzyme